MEIKEEKKVMEYRDLEEILDKQLLLLSEYCCKTTNPEHLLTYSYAMCELANTIRKTHTKSLYF